MSDVRLCPRILLRTAASRSLKSELNEEPRGGPLSQSGKIPEITEQEQLSTGIKNEDS